MIATAAPEYFATGEPAHHHQIVGSGDIEALAVHFFGELEVLGHAGRNWMAGLDDPDPLDVIRLAPLEVTGGAHQRLEDFREMARMQHNQAHTTFDHMFFDPDHDVVLDGVVGHMPPPHQHVGLGQYSLAQPMFGVIQSGSIYHKITTAGFESIGNSPMNALWVNGAGRMGWVLLMAEFIPYQYTRHCEYSYEKSNHHHYTTYDGGDWKVKSAK